MSDNQTPAVQRGLMDTDDPMVWSEEFCRIFNGKTITMNQDADGIDPDTMVGWFADAVQVALDMKERRDEIHANEAPVGMVPEAQRDAFVEGFEEGREADEA